MSRARWMGAALAVLACAPPARAADVTATLPVVDASPGAVVQVPITLSGSLVPWNVQSIQLQFPLNPTYVSGSAWLATGLVTTWGAPFTNHTATLASLATFGVSPITSGSLALATLQITVAPAAPPADVPLTLSLFRLNTTTPTTAVVNGLLRIRTGVGVGDPTAEDFGLSAPFPCPAVRGTTLAFTLPPGVADSPARLAVYAVDGRRVRTLARGLATPGAQAVRWDVRDDRGAKVPPGLYFARLECGARSAVRRVMVAN